VCTQSFIAEFHTWIEEHSYTLRLLAYATLSQSKLIGSDTFVATCTAYVPACFMVAPGWSRNVYIDELAEIDKDVYTLLKRKQSDVFDGPDKDKKNLGMAAHLVQCEGVSVLRIYNSQKMRDFERPEFYLSALNEGTDLEDWWGMGLDSEFAFDL
jgi:hypothetical protein